MNKKTIALTLLSLASVFALTTTSVKAVELNSNSTSTNTNMNVVGGGINISTETETVGFKEFKINGETGEQSSKATGAISLIVNDLRGTHGGWSVSANITPLSYTNEEVGVTDSITEASIVLENGVLSDSFEDTLDIKNSLEITTSPTPISTAKPGEGMGNWSHDWTAENTKLIIPSKEARDMYAGDYSTTITWTLTAGPQAN